MREGCVTKRREKWREGREDERMMEEDRGMWNEEGREEERGYMERCGE